MLTKKKSLFQEIDDFTTRDSDGHSSGNSSISDFLDTTLDAYESQVVIATHQRELDDNQQLNYIQQIFDQDQDFNISNETIYLDRRTTLMIRNIPNNYTKNMLIYEIEQKFWNKYDYLNFPFDFQLVANCGYAFINLKNKLYVRDFYNYFNGRQWNQNQEAKPCLLRYARVQQKKKILKPIKPQIYYQSSSLIQLVQNQKQQCQLKEI
ncbi:hypothetical protein pb186bvf_016106 [Paramecium bursaria]